MVPVLPEANGARTIATVMFFWSLSSASSLAQYHVIIYHHLSELPALEVSHRLYNTIQSLQPRGVFAPLCRFLSTAGSWTFSATNTHWPQLSSFRLLSFKLLLHITHFKHVRSHSKRMQMVDPNWCHMSPATGLLQVVHPSAWSVRRPRSSGARERSSAANGPCQSPNGDRVEIRLINLSLNQPVDALWIS